MVIHSVRQGDYYEANNRIHEGGVSVDITNVELIIWSIAKNDDPDQVALRRSYPASGIVITSGMDGRYRVIVSGAATATLDVGDYTEQYRYVLDNKPFTLDSDIFRVKPTIL
jgi:hypothetical protein